MQCGFTVRGTYHCTKSIRTLHAKRAAHTQAWWCLARLFVSRIIFRRWWLLYLSFWQVSVFLNTPFPYVNFTKSNINTLTRSRRNTVFKDCRIHWHKAPPTTNVVPPLRYRASLLASTVSTRLWQLRMSTLRYAVWQRPTLGFGSVSLATTKSWKSTYRIQRSMPKLRYSPGHAMYSRAWTIVVALIHWPGRPPWMFHTLF